MLPNERALGPVVDLWVSARKGRGPFFMGVLEAREDGDSVFLRLMGRDPQPRALDFDLVRVIFGKQAG